MSDIPETLPPTVFVELIHGTTKGHERWRWRAKNANNNKIIATSGEKYHNRQDCLDTITQVFGTNTDVYLTERGRDTMPVLRLAKDWK